jgi:hypothetical protein
MPSLPRGLGAAVLLAAFLAPLATAATSAGTLTTDGAASFGGPSSGAYQASAFYLADASNIGVLSLVGSAHVCHDEWRLQEVQLDAASPNPLYRGRTSQTEGCFDTARVILSLSNATQAGWLGGRFDAASAFDFSGPGPVSIEPSAYSLMASEAASTGATTDHAHDSYDEPWFLERTVGPHLNASQVGTVSYHGRGEIKFMGLTVMLETPTNRTEYQTGDSSTSGPVHERVWSWLTIDFEGDLALQTLASPMEIQAASGAVSWDGRASFVTDSGSLSVNGATYAAQPGTLATVEGRFLTDVKPADSEGRALSLSLRGDARSVSLGSAHVSSAPSGARFSGLTLAGVAVAAVVVAGGAAAILRRHAKPRRIVRAEALAREAAEAAEEGRAAEALARYQEAIELVPSGTYFLAAGLLLRGLERRGEALRYFERAVNSCRGGVVEYEAALCALALAEPEAASEWMLCALLRADLSAAILSVFATDAAFALLREREPVKRALSAAIQRQDAEGWPRLR